MLFALFLLMFCVSHCIALPYSDGADDSQLIRKPNETEIFGFLSADDNDWTDVLYACDFLKTFTFSCNVTQEGAAHLKNSSVSVVTGPKQPKFVIENVKGAWSDVDGVMKQHYVSVDYLDILAKCLFRTDYYECFGVPRCDGHGGMSDCHGGEPWRGQYQGAPNIGFKANVTNLAMESPAMPQEPAGNSNQPLIGGNPAADGLLSSNSNRSLPSSGQTMITLTNSSGTFISTGDISGAVQVPANGSLSIFRVSPVSSKNGTTSNGVQVSSFASFSSGTGSSPNLNSNRLNFLSTGSGFGGFGFPNLFGPRRPASDSRTTVTNETDSSATDFGLGSVNVPSSNSMDNCLNQSDFGINFRCLIQNFQKTVFQSLMNSFQSPNYQSMRSSVNLPGPMGFGSFGPGAPPMQQQQQSQSLGSMFQSQGQQFPAIGRAFGPRIGGYRVMIVSDDAPLQVAGRSDDDDMPGWMTSFRK